MRFHTREAQIPKNQGRCQRSASATRKGGPSKGCEEKEGWERIRAMVSTKAKDLMQGKGGSTEEKVHFKEVEGNFSPGVKKKGRLACAGGTLFITKKSIQRVSP